MIDSISLELLIVHIDQWRCCLWRHNAYHCITRDVNGAEFYKFEQIHFKIHSISGTRKIFNYYYVRHKAEMHENRRLFSTGMEFAKNAYAYVLKAPSRS